MSDSQNIHTYMKTQPWLMIFLRHILLFLIFSFGYSVTVNAAFVTSYECADSETVKFDRKYSGKPTEFWTVTCARAGQIIKIGKQGDPDLLATSYAVQRSSGRNTYTEAAFIVAGTAGTLQQAPFEGALYALGGNYLFPGLANASMDLFVGVDLNKWIPNEFAFTDGDVFDFINGISSSLPGFVVGTSEVTFSDTLGWTTAAPYTGLAMASGGEDGHIPEPGTLVLMGLGGGLIMIVQKGRRIR